MSASRLRRAAAVLLAAVLLHACRARGPGPDPLTALEIRAASDSADAHMRAGRYHEALRFMERIDRATRETTPDFEGAYATALRNAALEVRAVDGVPLPTTRSSVERVELVRRSLGRLDAGERKSPTPEQVTRLSVARGGQLVTWGFVREAYAAYWKAHEAAGLDETAQREAGNLERALVDPAGLRPPPAAGTAARR